MTEAKYSLEMPEIEARIRGFIRRKKRGRGYMILPLKETTLGPKNHKELSDLLDYKQDALSEDKFHNITCYCAIAALGKIDTEFALFSFVVQMCRQCLERYDKYTTVLIKKAALQCYIKYLRRPFRLGHHTFAHSCQAFLGDELFNEFRDIHGYKSVPSIVGGIYGALEG